MIPPSQDSLFNIRFMDDWVILAPTRWSLRKAVRIVNETLDELQVQQHPDKTFIGKTSRGFSFLGYEFTRDGLVGIARPTRQKFNERVRQLYEQGASVARIGEYVRRWLIWVTSGLTRLGFDVFATTFCPLRHNQRPIDRETH